VSSIDLNCDLGEGVVSNAVELALLDCVTSANIACGGHAGDAATIRRLALACLERGVGIGAHPSYPDRAGFGRVSLDISLDEIEESVFEQIYTFVGIVAESGGTVTHVKPHGALYHDAMNDPQIAAAIAYAAQSAAPDARLFGQPSTPGFAFWKERDRSTVSEAFADRRYEPDGTLRSRKLAGALLESCVEVASQALSIAREGEVFLADGSRMRIAAETICLHSDSPGVLEFAREVRRALFAGGVQVKKLGRA